MKSWSLATWAELLQFHTIWIVAAVLLGDVVTFFAVNARHSDLWADIRALAGHGDSLFLYLLLVNRGVRIPSLCGCGKKEGFSRIQRRKNVPGALVTFVTPSGALVQTITQFFYRFQLEVPRKNLSPGGKWFLEFTWGSGGNIAL